MGNSSVTYSLDAGWVCKCGIIHSRPRVRRRLAALVLFYYDTMEDEKFKQLMEEILQSRDEARQPRQEFETQLTLQLTDLRKDVTETQERTSQELVQRMSKSSYQFQKKGHERQFEFNSNIQSSIAAAQSEVAKVTPTSEKEKETLLKATKALDEGAKALATRQKHIQLADRSEYGWATIKYYEADPLAANSDDEKSIKKAEKEGQRDGEKKASLKRGRVLPMPTTGAGAPAHTLVISLGQVLGETRDRCQPYHPLRADQGCLDTVGAVEHLATWQSLVQQRKNCILFASLW